MEVFDLPCLKDLEEWSPRLRRRFTDLSLIDQPTKDSIKKGLVTDGRCVAVVSLVGEGVSVKSACQVVGLSPSTFDWEPTDRRARDAAVITAVQMPRKLQRAAFW